MINKTICTCERCQKGSYNPQDYMIPEEEFLQLNQPRPFGISGHLRAMNEALTVAECIESCIDALDELIITYNDSEDNTEEILKEYAAKYPDKIKLYHYKPWVAPATYREITQHNHKNFDQFRSSDNIHNSANYYNFGYTKISFSHYMKIDGDQIYFHKKIMKIKKTLKLGIKLGKNINNKNPFFSIILKILRRLFSKINQTFEIILAHILYKESLVLNMGGVELWLKENQLSTALVAFDHNKISFFNGCAGDTMLWIPTANTRYQQHPTATYETINIPGISVDVGFIWCHFGLIKSKVKIENQNLSFSLTEFMSLSWNQILQRTDHFKILDHEIWAFQKSFVFGQNFWDLDRSYLFDPSYQKILDKTLIKCIDFWNK
ncbi:MAG: glycosyltransferase [Brevinema sp.]